MEVRLLVFLDTNIYSDILLAPSIQISSNYNIFLTRVVAYVKSDCLIGFVNTFSVYLYWITSYGVLHGFSHAHSEAFIFISHSISFV